MILDRNALQQIVVDACELDVQAIKPGNIRVDSPAYAMSAQDFFASARAIAAPITAPDLNIGERIFSAIEATRRAVNCNTNLGIVLLLAPLIQAAQRAADSQTLESELKTVLMDLTIGDADSAYRAIRLAKPGGMGESAKHDIGKTPEVTLYQAMQEAAARDQIARLYTTGYEDLWVRALPIWRQSLARWQSKEWAATAIFLSTLSAQADTLITRKFGIEKSNAVSVTAKTQWQAFESAHDPNDFRDALLSWDSELKANGLNPGTTADITVATIFVAGLQVRG